MKICLVVISFFAFFSAIKASDTTKLKSLFRFDSGSHFSKPRNLFSRNIKTPDTLRWVSHFDETSCYIIKDEKGKLHVDQWDYNKLTGITFTPLNPMNNTAMIGWRHNPKTGFIELVPYWHVNKQRFFNENPHLTVAPHESFSVEIIVDKLKNEVTIALKTAKNQLRETKKFSKIPNRASLIQPYFGGTSRAPNAMQVFLQRNK